MPLTRIDSAFLDLDAIGGIDFDVQSGVPTLSVDATNHLVGIGTSSPVTKLQIAGNLTVGPLSTTDQYQGIVLINGKDSSSGETISFVDGKNNLGIADSDIRMAHEADGGSYIRFGTTPAGSRSTDRRVERVRITSDGYVGIGTASNPPVTNLQVVGDILAGPAGATQITAPNYLGTQITPDIQVSSQQNSTPSISLTHSRSNSLGSPCFILNKSNGDLATPTALGDDQVVGAVVFNGFDGTNYINAAQIRVEVDNTPGTTDMPGRLVFETTADGASTTTERMRITSAGKIEVKGTRAGSLQASDDDTLQLYTASTNNNIDRGSGITFYNHDNSGYEMGGTIQVAKENGTADDVASYMRFSTRPAGGSATERLRITSNGELVSTNGTLRRDVNDSSFTFGGGTASNAGANINVYGATHSSLASIFRVRSGSTEEFRVGSSSAGSEIAIGSGSEAANAYQIVEMFVGATDENYSVIRGKYNRTNQYNRSEVRFGVENNASGLGFLAFATGNNSATEKLRIDSSGNIGIGTTDPGALLHLESTAANAARLRIGFDSPRYYDIFRGSTTNSGYLNFYGSQSSFTGYIFDGVDGERLRIDLNGRLLKSGQAALTSTSLNHPIQVAAASDANAIAIIGRAADDIAELSYYEADKSTKLGEVQYRQDHANIRHRVGDIRFATGGTTERLRIRSDGNIRIGAGGAAGALLHLRDSDNTTQGASQLKISKGIGSGAAPATTSRANCYIHLGSSEWGSGANGQYLVGFGYTNGETGTGIPAYIGFKETSTSGYTQGDLIFGTRNNTTGTSNAEERLRIKSDGTIQFTPGGATTSSNASFDISGDNFRINTKKDGSGGCGFIVRTQNSGALGERLRVASNGQVLVGNYATHSAIHGNLEVNGNDGINISNATRTGINGAQWRLIPHSGGSNTYATTNLRLYEGDGGIEVLNIQKEGQVMIGHNEIVSHPNMDDLQIGDSSGNRGITVASGSTGFGTLAFGDSTDGSGNDRYQGYVEYYHNDNSMRLGTVAQERVNIASNGDVRIGASSFGTPKTKLDIIEDQSIPFGITVAGSAALFVGVMVRTRYYCEFSVEFYQHATNTSIALKFSRSSNAPSIGIDYFTSGGYQVDHGAAGNAYISFLSASGNTLYSGTSHQAAYGSAAPSWSHGGGTTDVIFKLSNLAYSNPCMCHFRINMPRGGISNITVDRTTP